MVLGRGGEQQSQAGLNSLVLLVYSAEPSGAESIACPLKHFASLCPPREALLRALGVGIFGWSSLLFPTTLHPGKSSEEVLSQCGLVAPLLAPWPRPWRSGPTALGQPPCRAARVIRPSAGRGYGCSEQQPALGDKAVLRSRLGRGRLERVAWSSAFGAGLGNHPFPQGDSPELDRRGPPTMPKPACPFPEPSGGVGSLGHGSSTQGQARPDPPCCRP